MGGRIILPIEGRLHICSLEGEHLVPLGALPGAEDAQCFPCYASGRVAVVDSQRKRIGLFALTGEAPWVERVLPFSTLPASCIAHVALPLEGGLLVGGHGEVAEALWWRHPRQASDRWEALDLPPKIRKPGKAIDGLHLDGQRLIAVDDIVTPKWLVLYAIGQGPAFTHQRLVQLPSHGSYERVIDSFLGEQRLWCLSRGMNHGTVSTHLWGLDLVKFKEKARWSVHKQGSKPISPLFCRLDAGARASSPLETACAVVQWQRQLLVACKENGLIQLPLSDRPAVGDPAQDLRRIGVSLTDVGSIQIHPDDPDLGVFLIGTGADGAPDWEWLPAKRLAATDPASGE